MLPNIEGAKSEQMAVESFKTYFRDLGNAVDHSFDTEMSNKFRNLYFQHKNARSNDMHMLTSNLFNITLIEMAVCKLHNGKSPGLDQLQKEHLTYAHPVLYEILAKLFYIIFASGYVPRQFGKGVIVPIQKDTSLKGTQKLDNFRGITLSPIVSKIFEQCIIFLFGKFFESNERQFGFKQNLGCAHAIFSVRRVVEFFVMNDSSVNVCCLDMSKAFDRLNHNCLFYKLLSRSVPLCLVNILIDWYSKIYSVVRWGSSISDEFKINCGVRQGGVMSPILFCMYVDNILSRLSKFGCKMNNVCYSSFMYADDLILLSPSICELQKMLSICCTELTAIGLELNTKKSCCLRIGKRHSIRCNDLVTNKGTISWVKETRYLGVTIASGNKFKISFSETKCRFYSSFNNLYSKLGNIPDLRVTTHLLETIAVPVLTYGLEALNLTNAELSSLDFTLNRAIYKIFKVSDKQNIALCMNMFGISSISDRYIILKKRFLKKISSHDNVMLVNLMQ